MMKKAAVGLGGIVLLVMAAIMFLFVGTGGAGHTPVESWIASELREAVNAHLVPECDFDSLAYQAPLTVVLTNFRITAPDPDNPGQTIDIIAAERVTMILEELPREGKPLRISKLDLDRPTVRLVQARDGSGLIGFSNLIQPQPDNEASPISGPQPDKEASPISDLLRITRLDFRAGALVYEARSGDTQPLTFTGLAAGVDIKASSPKTYQVALDLSQGPRFKARLDGSFNLDALTMDVRQFALQMKLQRDQHRDLPPQVQQVLEDFDLRGDARLTATGAFNVRSWRDSTLEAELQLDEGHAMAGEYVLPVDRLRLEATMAQRRVEVRRIDADLFEGRVRGDAVIQLNEAFDADIRLGADRLNLEKTLEPVDSLPRYAGLLNVDVSVQAPLADQGEGLQLYGQGQARLWRGRIAQIAVISDVIDFMAGRGDLRRRRDDGSDQGEARFRLRGDHIYFEDLEIIGSWFAMRGRGKVYFNNRLDMVLNAGPFQRGLASLGRVGDALGSVTDNLIAYRIRGSFDDPDIGVAPFTGLIGVPGERDRPEQRPTDSRDTDP
ncbi:MAG: AsmA-like C-terminal region-containing protein [Planctomycetota bacterium]